MLSDSRLRSDQVQAVDSILGLTNGSSTSPAPLSVGVVPCFHSGFRENSYIWRQQDCTDQLLKAMVDRIVEENLRKIRGYPEVAFHPSASEEVRRLLGALKTLVDEVEEIGNDIVDAVGRKMNQLRGQGAAQATPRKKVAKKKAGAKKKVAAKKTAKKKAAPKKKAPAKKKPDAGASEGPDGKGGDKDSKGGGS